MNRVGILFSDFGPYHVARIEALGRSLREAGRELVAFRFTERSDTYGWEPVCPKAMETVTLADRYPAGAGEAARLAWRFRGELRNRGVGAVFLPTYSPLPNLLCLLAAKSAGCRTVLMTESWLGTEQAGLAGRLAKHVLVRMFDSALVGGTPQRDFVVAYGMPADKVFTGYDVIDVDSFAARADEVRTAAKKSLQSSVFSGQQGGNLGNGTSSALSPQLSALEDTVAGLGLPERFFLNLGRFVEKKNLSTLIAAYGRYCDQWREPESAEIGRRGDQPSGEGKGRAPVALVLVGEGPLRGELERQARELGLRVIDRDVALPVAAMSASLIPAGSGDGDIAATDAEDCKPTTANSVEQHGTVLFYGFQQSDMTPVFFALCEAFILPSLREEWGLVVNEAMACGAPVLVSNKVGSGFDLVSEGVNGFRFDHGDREGLARLLERFSADAGLKERLGNEGARMIRNWRPERFGEEGGMALNAAEGAKP